MTAVKELDYFRPLSEDDILKDLGDLLREHQRSAPGATLLAASTMDLDMRSPFDAGKRFWEQFKEAAAESICDPEKGLVSIVDESELEKQLALVITPLLVARFGVVAGALASIAAALVILVVKTGIKAFCRCIGQDQKQEQEA